MAPIDPRDQSVAVIGLGAMGIVAVKNLLEEGFDVTGFERSSYVGGLWHFTEDEETLSVLKSTVVNVSIARGSYTDFPFERGTPSFCSAQAVNDYLESYVDHFGLRPRMRLGTAVKRIAREHQIGKWRLDFESAASEHFDKVVIATGPHHDPIMPDIQGSGLFAGRIIHSKRFKRSDDFSGKKVIILGLGNTGCDVAEELVGKASSITIAHNHGAIVLPRDLDKARGSASLSYRFSLLVGFLESWCPSYSEYLFNQKAKYIMQSAFGNPDPDWQLDPAPSIKVVNPVVSDTLFNRLRSGEITSVPGIRQIVGPNAVELEDGRLVEADAIICCTGYKYGFDLVDSEISPTAEKSDLWLAASGSKGRGLPRLYQNIFSLKEPDSLAFLGCAWFVTSAFSLADIASMCIAQVWAGHSSLPPQVEMEKWMARQERRISSLAQRGTVIPASVPAREWLIWADKTAGMGVEENLGWGWKGWLFWLKERQLWGMLMDGPQTAAVWRLFAGKRKNWDGARVEIEHANTSFHGSKDKKD